MSGRPDFKAPGRTVDPNAGRDKVAQEGRCRACKRVGGHPIHGLNRAHLIPRSQRGHDVDANIIPLGGSGTTGCHGIQTSRNPGENCQGVVTSFEQVAAQIRASLLPQERQHVIAHKSRAWLERMYPARAQTGGIFVDVPDANELDALYTLIEETRKDFGLPAWAPVKDVLATGLHFALTAPKESVA